jgi:hypothetical protein
MVALAASDLAAWGWVIMPFVPVPNEARRNAMNIAKLPEPAGKGD